MTRLTPTQQGVTLVEVMLTLAISTLLIVTVLSGRNSVRSRAQFNDGMERIKESILSVKSEANTSNNTIGRGAAKPTPSSTSQYLTIGRSIHFSRSISPNKADTKTLLCDTSSALNYACGLLLSYPPESSATIVLPWGITYTGYSVGGVAGATTVNDLTLLFVRDDGSGAYNGYWYAGNISRGMAKNTAFANQSEVSLQFKTPDGRRAAVIVNPASGSVTWREL